MVSPAVRRPGRAQAIPVRGRTDGDFDGAETDQGVVEEAWSAWREEIAFAEQFARNTDLGFIGRDSADNPISLRELLVHMIEEYAWHNDYADLLRERIDGRIGQ